MLVLLAQRLRITSRLRQLGTYLPGEASCSGYAQSALANIVEIETPAKTLVTSGLQMSAQATQAITQAMQYRAFLLERFQEANVHFPEFRDPDCLVVLGLERELTTEQRRALALENTNRRELRIVGFDWIAERAERILQNMISANIAVRPVRMI